ncbi:DUF2007 domain-containing protein [Chloroflexota bacterium]
MSNSEKLVKIYQATGELEAQVVKGLLESNGIPCILESAAARSVHVFTIDGMGEIGIMVHQSMVDDAKKLIRDKDDV